MIDFQINLGGDYVDGHGDDAIVVEHGDFVLRDGKFLLVPEDDIAQQVGQRLHVRLLLRRGEVFFNTLAGFPYADIGKFKRSSGIFDSYMKSYILATDGVYKLKSYGSSMDSRERKQSVRFEVTTKSDETIEISKELDV